MPLYEYICEQNGRKVEIRHGITEELKTWGEVCERAGIDPGSTPKTAKVARGFGGGMVIVKNDGASTPPPATGGSCGVSCGCH